MQEVATEHAQLYRTQNVMLAMSDDDQEEMSWWAMNAEMCAGSASE